MDDTIQFIANYRDWVAVKKLKIEEKTDPMMIAEFLASLSNSFDRKIGENLGKIVKLENVDAVLTEELGKVRGAEGIAKALSVVAGTKMNKAINEITGALELQKKEKQEVIDFCKVYAMRKALKQAGLMVDYSEIEIPGMKKPKSKDTAKAQKEPKE